MAKKSEKTVLDYALEYHQFGWCVIPIKPDSKKPALKSWKQFQTKRPDENQLRKWFVNNNRNIAVVLGAVSNNLVCRDFDKAQAVKIWKAKYPNLAKKLPIVQTQKGIHIYFQARVEGIKTYSDGELRGKGGYCLLPPSVHPDGSIYQWVNPLVNGNLIFIEPELAGFIPDNIDVTEQSEQTEQIEAIVCDRDIEKAITATLPQEFRTRNRQIFEFARVIKSLPQFSDADPKRFRSVVVEWHKRALPKIRTKEFEETWIDFLKAWPRIKYKKGEEPIMKIFESAIQLEPPQIAVEKYPDHSKLKILVSLCRELQQAAGRGPFYLSARTTRKLLDISPMQASRWLFLLVSDRILQIDTKGGMAETVRKATRYRYIAN